MCIMQGQIQMIFDSFHLNSPDHASLSEQAVVLHSESSQVSNILCFEKLV